MTHLEFPSRDDRRRPYTAPRLVVHGELRALTLRNGGNQGSNDMGGGWDKTGFG